MDAAKLLKKLKEEKKEKMKEKEKLISSSEQITSNAIANAAIASRIESIIEYDTSKLLFDPSIEQDWLYVPNICTLNEEIKLMECIQGSISHSSLNRMNFSKRTLLNLGGVPHPDGIIQERFPKWIDPLIDALSPIFNNNDIPRPNQALINIYSATGGISWHKDGPLYSPMAAIVSLKSTSVIHFRKDRAKEKDDVNENEKENDPNHLFSFILEPRSVLIFRGKLYNDYKHSIFSAESENDFHDANLAINKHLLQKLEDIPANGLIPRRDRMSITVRCCPRVQRIVEDDNEAKAISSSSTISMLKLAKDMEAEEERKRRYQYWSKAVGE